MPHSASTSASLADAPAVPIRASRLLHHLRTGDTAVGERLVAVYGDDPLVLEDRARAVDHALERFLETHGDLPCAVYRAPARLSLNPHCDHQGAWVPYVLHIRELLAVAAVTADDRVVVTNVDPAFRERLEFRPGEDEQLAPKAWAEDWFRYIEAPAVKAERDRCVDPRTRTSGRTGTLNYVRAAVLRLRRQGDLEPYAGLRLTLNGNIAQGGGQSSSSAIVVNTALALMELKGGRPDRTLLAERCGEAEWFVGTRGGSGDHAAMLLGRAGAVTHLCFRAPFGIRDVRHSAFPRGYELIVANSQTRSEKSAEEKRLFNLGIFAYRFAYLALRDALAAEGVGLDLLAEVRCLGDIHARRFEPSLLFRLLRRLPPEAAADELRRRYPDQFAAAAHGCFGSDRDEDLPPSIPLRGAAGYGLGRVDRGLAMPDLLDAATEDAMREFGELMSITHDGDRLFRGGRPFLGNRQSLSDEELEVQIRLDGAGPPRPLRFCPGFYGASIAELDEMVDIAQETPGVLGAGLMGAGGGGYILVFAREGTCDRLRDRLVDGYYRPHGKEPDVERWRPAPPAGRIL